ncbi:SusC/RagA family TonB-linked outer membrane protein [Sinomicrobium sp. FJxs]|uniref:SusC/RagA family TonB-linked outer membrane protein n=2 Tax=Sinomicrobium weinanense TaxID=2842200 RepID=A0A926JQD3_9FLAO|nr:SusC/RagA family TonB-linked outer membrane protein [Sinomicrobium weinanense]MBU3122913.1 SusC/RagA family TonB-linked outer membrane protein [Sinomicrobium weinanense]
MKEATLQKVLDEVERTTDFRFHYKETAVDLSRKVTIRVRRKGIETILDTLFKDTGVFYEIADKNIILTPRIKAPKEQDAPPAPKSTGDSQQYFVVSGTVTDTNGEPLAGANIIVKSTRRGTLADIDGSFSIKVSPKDVLIFSYLGYKTVEIPLLNREPVEVQMEEDVMTLKGAEVNAGYYTVKERERTGNIAKVTSEEIELQPIVSPIEALQGRMAGVEIQQQSGVPGNAPIIRIRGRNSLRDEGNYPLYIIDGVPINSAPIDTENLFLNDWDPLSTLNLSNIESIEVLKDADATAIYGSRGANGVVLITTKKGAGYNRKTEVQARWYNGFAQVGRKMKILNTEQYISMRKAAYANAGLEPNQEDAWDLLLWDTNRYTDWPEKLLGGSSSVTDINLAASGGNATTSFRLGGSYHKQGTIFPLDNNYHKVTAAVNLNHTSENKKLRIDLSVNYGVDKSEASGVRDLVRRAYQLPPNAPRLYNEDGSLHWEEWGYSRVDDNPLAEQNSITVGQVNNLVANLGLSYELFSGLNFKTNMGYTYTVRESKGKIPNTTAAPWEREDIEHVATQNYQKRLSWIIEPQLNYHSTIGKGAIDALVGTTFQKNESDGFGVWGEGFVSEILLGYIPAAELYRSFGDGRNIHYKYSALYGRLGYNWQQKYFINFTGRRDGSSRFGPNNRFANFWAVGAAWIFSEEPFVKKNLPFLSFGKFRGSYGVTGSDQIGDYQYLDAYEATPGPNGLYPTQLFNPDFAWEENKKLEAAMEVGFLQDRINLGVSWYRNRSSNQLVGYPLAAITGFTSVQANLPATVENTGWELELSTLNIKSKNFKWQTFFNISFPKNKLVNFPNIDQTSYANRYRVGHPLNILLRYQYNGIDPETGLYQVLDVNEDGSYDYQDRVVIKDIGRQYYGGITNNFSYKGVRLSFLWDFAKQTAVKPFIFSQPPGNPYNRPLEDYKAWKSGDLYIENSPATKTAYTLALLSERGIVDASFLRLKTVSFGYDLPSEVLNTIGIKKLRIFCAAQNLFTITSYSGLNLELISGGSSLPALQTVTAGLQLQL